MAHPENVVGHTHTHIPIATTPLLDVGRVRAYLHAVCVRRKGAREKTQTLCTSNCCVQKGETHFGANERTESFYVHAFRDAHTHTNTGNGSTCRTENEFSSPRSLSLISSTRRTRTIVHTHIRMHHRICCPHRCGSVQTNKRAPYTRTSHTRTRTTINFNFHLCTIGERTIVD